MGNLWRTYGNLVIIVMGFVLGALILNVREVIRSELKGYVTQSEFLASWKSHSEWAESELSKQMIKFNEIQRQLEEGKLDRRRMEDKLDRLIERIK